MMKKPNASLIWSTVGKKIFLSLTGLSLVFFLIVHLLGNLTLFVKDPDLINKYAPALEGLGPVIVLAEIIILIFFVFHMYLAITETFKNWRARSSKYIVNRDAGGASKKSLGSSTMIYTGILMGIFTIIHLVTIKFGPGLAEGYSTVIDGESVRDLHRLVVEIFQNPYYVIGYVLVIGFFGFHLRHGFWSAFQSLGANRPSISPLIYTVAGILAFILAAGFIAIPIWVYFIY